MQQEKKERIYEELHGQICYLVKDISDYFIELGESGFLMEEYRFYEVKFEKFELYLYKVDADNTTLRRLIQIYKFFKDYPNTERGRVLMYIVGWSKLIEFVKRADKLQKALDTGAINYDDLVMYAYRLKKEELINKLKEQPAPALWRDVYYQTHICEGRMDVFKEGIIQTMEAVSQLYSSGPVAGFKTPFVVAEKLEDNSLSDRDLMEILGRVRAIAREYAAIYTKFERKTFPDLVRISSLNQLEDMAFYKTHHDFQAIVNEQDLIREMLGKDFVNLEQLSEITGVSPKKCCEWLNGKCSKDNMKDSTGELFSLRDAGKVQFVKEDLDKGLSEDDALGNAERKTQEYEKYRIRVPYEELARKAQDVVDCIDEGQILREGGRSLRELRQKGWKELD